MNYSGIRSGVASVTAGYMFVYKLVGTVFYHLLLRIENKSKPELQHVVSVINSVDSDNSLVCSPGEQDVGSPDSKLEGLIATNLSDFVHKNQNQIPYPKNPTLFRIKF